MSALPRPVLFAWAIEVLFLAGAWLFLVRPRMIFGARADAVTGPWATIFRGIGFFAACALFCWSIILGALLLLHGVMVRF